MLLLAETVLQTPTQTAIHSCEFIEKWQKGTWSPARSGGKERKDLEISILTPRAMLIPTEHWLQMEQIRGKNRERKH